MSPEEAVAELLRRGDWKAVEDKASGRTYFYNPVSKERVWNLEKLVASKGIHLTLPLQHEENIVPQMTSTSVEDRTTSMATASAHHHKRLSANLPAVPETTATTETTATSKGETVRQLATAQPSAAALPSKARNGTAVGISAEAAVPRRWLVQPLSRGALLALLAGKHGQPASPPRQAADSRKSAKTSGHGSSLDSLSLPGGSSLLCREMYDCLSQILFFRETSADQGGVDAPAVLVSKTLAVGTFLCTEEGITHSGAPSATWCSAAVSLRCDAGGLTVAPVLVLDGSVPSAHWSQPMCVAHPLMAIRPAGHDSKDHEFLLLELLHVDKRKPDATTSRPQTASPRSSLGAFEVTLSSVACRGAFRLLSPSPRGIPWEIVAVDEHVLGLFGPHATRSEAPGNSCPTLAGARIIHADDVMPQEPLWSTCATQLGKLPLMVAQIHSALLDARPRCGACRSRGEGGPEAFHEASATSHTLGSVEKLLNSVLANSICDPVLRAQRSRGAQTQHEPVAVGDTAFNTAAAWDDHTNLFRRWERHCDPEVLKRMHRQSKVVTSGSRSTGYSVAEVVLVPHHATPLDVCLAELELLESSLRLS